MSHPQEEWKILLSSFSRGMFSGRFRFYAYLCATYTLSVRVPAFSDRPSADGHQGTGNSHTQNFLCACMHVCVCACACVRARERAREKEKAVLGSTQKPNINPQYLWSECSFFHFSDWGRVSVIQRH